MMLISWFVGQNSDNYKFNMKAGRFVEAYLMGYVNGRNTNDDTPVLSGGVCKKIE